MVLFLSKLVSFLKSKLKTYLFYLPQCSPDSGIESYGMLLQKCLCLTTAAFPVGGHAFTVGTAFGTVDFTAVLGYIYKGFLTAFRST